MLSNFYVYTGQLYDNSGQLFSQTALEDAIDPKFNLVDMADDKDGNLHILTQSNNAITGKAISELFSFDSKGALIGKPLVIPVEDFVSQSQIELDNKGNIFLYFSSFVSR